MIVHNGSRNFTLIFIVGKFGLGSVKKKEKTKQKVIPDMFSLATTTWNVQVYSIAILFYLQLVLFSSD